MMMKKRASKLFALFLSFVLMGLAIGACGDGNSGASNSSSDSTSIRVGSKDFTENLIVAELYSLALEAKGFTVDRKFNLASSVMQTTIINDDIDLYPEYTGTGLLDVLKHSVVTDLEQVYQIVKDEYQKQFNLVWLDYAQANDGQGLVITKKASDDFGIKTISELQKSADKIRFVSQGEFDQRSDALPALVAAYGPFDWKSSKVYDNSLKYKILSSGEGDVAPAYTTEGSLTDPSFLLLEDDKHVWPPYNLAPVVRQDLLDKHPEVADILNAVSVTLTTEGITQLNAKVDIDKQEYDAVAKEYFTSLKLD